MLDRPHRHQRPGIAFLRRVDDLPRRAIFDLLAISQHQNVVRNLRDDGKIMGDVQGRHPGIADGLLDRGQHLDLGCHVQRRRGFVKHHQIRFGTQRHRRHRPLQLPPRHLMRIAAAKGFGVGKTQPPEQLHRPRLGLLAAHQLVLQAGLDHLIHQPPRRVERRRCRLRDIGHLMPAQRPQARRIGLEDIAPVQRDRPAGQPHATPPVSHRRQPDGRLARPAFADQPQHPPLGNRDRDIIDQHQMLGCLARRIGRCLDPEVLDLQQISHRVPLSRKRSATAPSPPQGSR